MTVWSQHLTFRLLTKVRGALVSSIFVSTLETRTTEATSSAQPISLMSTEIDRISYTLQWSLAIVPNLIQVGVGLWILHSYIDKAVVAPALVAIGRHPFPHQRQCAPANDNSHSVWRCGCTGREVHPKTTGPMDEEHKCKNSSHHERASTTKRHQKVRPPKRGEQKCSTGQRPGDREAEVVQEASGLQHCHW